MANCFFEKNETLMKYMIAWLSLAVALVSTARAETSVAPTEEKYAAELAAQVTIHRDDWGVAHIFGDTDEATLFGSGYCQAEDFFWQLEDTTIQALGRYAEVMGKDGLKTDLLVRSFEIPRKSEQDFAESKSEYKRFASAFAGGINHFLRTHPAEKPRLIHHFEPWHIIAIDRYLMLTLTYRFAAAGNPRPEEAQFSVAPSDLRVPKYSWQWDVPAAAFEREMIEAVGSNAWAIAPSRTKSGNAMLMVNPHQPWYGIGQFYEMHIHSAESLRFTGGCFFGTPIPTLGHNDRMGWTYTVNEPDVADSWQVVFDDPAEPLNYRYGDGHRQAIEWTEEISIRQSNLKQETKNVTFRKTHHGPIVRQQGDRFVAAQVGRLYSADRFEQALAMIRAENFQQWKQAFSACQIPMFNVVYADRDGTIFFGYNGAVPVRQEGFAWDQTVDGGNPETEWNGYHTFDQLPQILNPSCGYVQSCNSSPFVTTELGFPGRDKFPSYMVGEAELDRRRSKRSKQILGQATDLTFDDFQQLTFDTKLYWPLTNLATWQQELADLQQTDPEKAAQVKPYLDHLAAWDMTAQNDSTAAALCIGWYEEMHGVGDVESIKQEYRDDPTARLMALVKVGKSLQGMHGDWRVPWGDVHRILRVGFAADTMAAGVSMLPSPKSLPLGGSPGPLGVVFTIYSSPMMPFIRPQRFAVVGCSYMSAVEFGDQVRGGSLLPYGVSGDPSSPHFDDQRILMSERRYKPAYFYPADVLAAAKRSYHPGQESVVQEPVETK
jgi:penicillin amidase